jgi:hypothetical protein
MQGRSDEEEKIRKQRNSELIKRMREGDPLRTHDATSSWYPPRPVISKDSEAVQKIYRLQQSSAKPKQQEHKKDNRLLLLTPDKNASDS